MLLRRGYRVTGSDRLLRDPSCLDQLSPPIRLRLQRLQKIGAVLFPQNGEGVTTSTSRVVISTAIESDNLDLQRAGAFQVPIVHRTDELKTQLQHQPFLAVAGTSGKSTTAALCAWLLHRLDALACFVGGAELLAGPRESWSSVLVGNGEWAVAELDESDKSFLRFEPHLSVILNINRDHHDLDENLDCFEHFARQTRTVVLCNQQDSGCQMLMERLAFPSKVQTFFPPSRDQVVHREEGMEIMIEGTRWSSPLMGLHNASNLAAALAMVRLAVPLADPQRLLEAVRSFPGVRRRLQRYGRGPIAVFDDYAHNPDKLAALLDCLAERFPRLHLVFQPHGYGPLRFHLEGYVRVFSTRLRSGDELCLLPVYDAGGTTDRSIASDDLAARISSQQVFVFPDRRILLDHLRQTARPGDVITVAGARDDTLAELAATIASAMESTADSS